MPVSRQRNARPPLPSHAGSGHPLSTLPKDNLVRQAAGTACGPDESRSVRIERGVCEAFKINFRISAGVSVKQAFLAGGPDKEKPTGARRFSGIRMIK